MNYFKEFGLSSSKIKGLIKKGIENKEETRNLVVGSIVDLILTENNEDCFIVDDLEDIPTGKVKDFLDELIKLYDGKISEKEIKTAYELAKIKKKKIEELTLELESDYWKFLVRKKEEKNKYIITLAESLQIQTAVENIHKSRFEDYFNNKSYKQLEIYTDEFKIKLDSVTVDKGIIYLNDLKTIDGHTENFMFNYTNFRYDIQAYFYHYVFNLIMSGVPFKTNDERFLKDFNKLKSLTLSNYFNFIFVSKTIKNDCILVRNKVEPTKETNTKILYTYNDVMNGIRYFKMCKQIGNDISLGAVIKSNNFEITI